MTDQGAVCAGFDSFDNAQTGHMGGKFLASLLQAGDRVGVIEGLAGSQSSEDRASGAKAVFAEAGMSIVAAMAWISQFPDLKTIYCCGDGMAMGVIQAVNVPDIVNESFSRIVLNVQLALAQRAHVYIGRNLLHRALRSTVIESDNESGGRQAAEEMIRRGCRRIALLREGRSLSTSSSREAGFRTALKNAGLDTAPEQRLMVQKADERSACGAVSFALMSGRRFDGFFCRTDWLPWVRSRR